MALIESESQRRYEMDQIIASARLEGAAPSVVLLTLMDRYVRGEITLSDFGRQADELANQTDYAALARSLDATNDSPSA